MSKIGKPGAFPIVAIGASAGGHHHDDVVQDDLGRWYGLIVRPYRTDKSRSKEAGPRAA